MSVEYDRYLSQHIENVNKGFYWISDNLPELTQNVYVNINWTFGFKHHDESKTDIEEYAAYDKYFYGGNKSYQVVQDFNYAWLRHIHRNPHHWQYWVLINDDPNEGEIILDMPYRYILEMVCDWWAFSWAKEDLTAIFKWYDKHKDYIKLSDKTRATVEDILDKIKAKLKEKGEI